MRTLITGTSRGIGRAAAARFLREGHEVTGIDILPPSIADSDVAAGRYTHFIADIRDKDALPDLEPVDILVNNAGIQSATEEDIRVNLVGTMNATEKYAFHGGIKSVLFVSSASALTGNEFPAYAASKAGVNGYMKNCAIRLANGFGATCNALCFGGVLTEMNRPVTGNPALWKRVMDVTPLKRWATAEQAAEWIWFMTAVNTFCTGQAIDISGGERNCADLFVWE